MLTSAVRQQVDKSWDEIWSGGITNPIVVSDLLGTILMVGHSSYHGAWEELLGFAASGKGHEISERIVAIRRRYGIAPGSEIENPDFWRDSNVLSRAMKSLDGVLHATLETDVLGDIYEHILSKLSTAGHFGQFRTPKHIIEFMVEAIRPSAGEAVLDPACGSGGFLVAAANYRRKRGLPGTYTGFEIDRTIGRIASANMIFHQLNGGTIHALDGLVQSGPDADVILANPPFAGSVPVATAATFECGSKKTELLFVEAMINRLREGGRAAVVVPMGVLTGAGKAERWIREILVTRNNLRAVVELPSGVFRPYTDVKTGIIIWEGGSSSSQVKMIKVNNDGFSLDQRRIPTAGNELAEALNVILSGHGEVTHADVSLEQIRAARYSLGPSRYIPNAEPGANFAAPDMAHSIREIGESLANLSKQLESMKAMVD